MLRFASWRRPSAVHRTVTKLTLRHASKATQSAAKTNQRKVSIPLRCHIPLDSIPKSIQKKMDKAEKYLNSLGVSIQKIQCPPNSDSTSSSDNALVVGSMQQYPQIAHFNQARILEMFGKTRLHRKSWSFDAALRKSYNVAMTTALDYFPFAQTTFDGEKKATSAKWSKWKQRRKGLNLGHRDSFDERLPRLTREHFADGSEQQLIVYRDVPFDLHSLAGVCAIIAKLEPDAIVFEFGRLPFFDKFAERRFSFSNLATPFKKVP